MPRTMSAILTLLTLTACVSGRPEPARGGLRGMLAGRSVVFENGAAQSFAADGTTVYELGAAQIGRWKVEDGRYCALWPSARQWQCHRVEPAGPGFDLVFIAKDGHRTAARYSHAP